VDPPLVVGGQQLFGGATTSLCDGQDFFRRRRIDTDFLHFF